MLEPKAITLDNQVVYLERILQFLKEIGLEYSITDENYNSFLKGIIIKKGKLIINLKNLISIGDILHEAGHLACIPTNLRLKANDDISESLGEEFTCEIGVIAWSVAAVLHLEIPLSELFHSEGYNGNSKWLLEQYSSNNYIGLPLLQWMGLAVLEGELYENNILLFPKMLRWTRI